MKKISLLALFALIVLSSTAHASRKALVYKGPGSCEDGCSEAVFDVAKEAGFVPEYVGPEALDENSTQEQVIKLFGNAKLWLQPGGISNEAFYSMTPRMRTELYNYVKNGGGYVGFCAGAFMATSRIGGTRDAGLGIFPGGTYPYGYWPVNQNVVFSLEKLNWLGSIRTVYFEGGPYLYGIENNPAVEIIARYERGSIAAARTVFGSGRVYVTGAHPEAPTSWWEEEHVENPAGVSTDLAINMIRWAGHRADDQPKAIKIKLK